MKGRIPFKSCFERLESSLRPYTSHRSSQSGKGAHFLLYAGNSSGSTLLQKVDSTFPSSRRVMYVYHMGMMGGHGNRNSSANVFIATSSLPGERAEVLFRHDDSVTFPPSSLHLPNVLCRAAEARTCAPRLITSFYVAMHTVLKRY